MSAQTPSLRLGAVLLALILLQAAFTGVVDAGPTAVNHEGDVAWFPIDHSGAQEAKIQIGNDEVNYNVTLTVRGGYDDRARIYINTYKAGGWNGAPPSEVFSVQGGSLVDIERTTPSLSNPLESGSYRIYTHTNGQLSDISILSLKERSTNDVTVFTAPKGTDTGKLSEIKKRATKMNEIAEGDYLIAKVNASGLGGYIQSVDDIQQGKAGVSLSIYSERPNAGRDSINLQRGEFYREGDHLYFVFDTNDIDAVSGEKYTLEFRIDGEDNPYVADDETEKVTQQVKFRERRLTYSEGDTIIVGAAKQQRINFTTTMAPGTKLTFEVISDSLDNAFVKHTTIWVTKDQTMWPTFNFQGISDGTEFELTVKGEDITRTGYVGRSPGELTPTPTTTETVTATPTSTETPTTPETTTTDEKPVGTTTPEEGMSMAQNGSAGDTTATPSSDQKAENMTTRTETGKVHVNKGDTSTDGGIPTKIVGIGLAVLFVGVIVKIAT